MIGGSIHFIREVQGGTVQEWLKDYEKEWSGWKPQWVRDHIQSRLWVGAQDEGVLTSLILFQKIDDLVEIYFLWTLKKYRRQGHMQQLFRHLISQYRNGQFWLEVSPSNHPALTLYESLGFRQQGRRATYYRDHGEAYLLTL